MPTGRGPANHQWKGGVIVTKEGYRKIRNENGRYTFEHRLVMEGVLGRKLDRNELIHHINHDRLDNRPDNLKIVTRSSHQREHAGVPHFVPKRLSDEYLIGQLQRYVDVHGQIPSPDRLGSKYDMPSLHVYMDRFGSWAEAVRVAGFSLKRPGKHCPSTIERIRVLHRKGMSAPKIAKALGVSCTSVYSYINGGVSSQPRAEVSQVDGLN